MNIHIGYALNYFSSFTSCSPLQCCITSDFDEITAADLFAVIWQAQAADASYSLDDDKISKRSESSSSSPVKGNMERSYEDGLLSASPVITPREHNGPNASLRKALSHSALPAAYLSERQGD